MKNLLLLALLLLCSFVAGLAHAGQATINWGAVTQDTNGATLTGAVTYKVYSALQGQTKTLLASGISATTYVASNLAAGNTYCFEVTANVAGLPESDRSNEGCKAIPLVPPKAPVITISQNVFQKQAGKVVLVGRTTLGVKCGPDAHCKAPSGRELYNIPRNKVVFAPHKDNGTQTFGVCA